MKGKTGNHKEAEYSWGYKKPEDDNRTLKEKIRIAFYNPSTGTVLGRTPLDWGRLLLFYILLYLALALLFAICMKGLLLTIDLKHPKWILEESIIGTNPGMGYRPMPKMAEDGKSLVWYQANNKSNVAMWEESINAFLKPYMNEHEFTNRIFCDYDMPKPSEDKVCEVYINETSWGPCTKRNHYSFPSSSPCVFLKLNRIYGWTPEYYEDLSSLPPEMPSNLRSFIENEKAIDPRRMNTIWVSCNPETPFDNETMGEVEYYPRQGFPGYYYPYKNQDGYLSPLIAVRFKRPPVGILVNVECRAWAKNIIYQRPTGAKDRQGSVHFEILVDP
uniref:Na,K-ATPase beta 1 n=1 Tax=Oncopeltus fasciatus TaxID=7536 RepID=A0A8S4MTC7_ONCFA|nr:Na,K-ATPase beta 1 [Oncopeltus fasciatus]